MNNHNRYLDLMRNILTCSMWEDPPLPFDALAMQYPRWSLRKFAYFRMLRPLLEKRNFVLCKRGVHYWPVQAHTMMPMGMLKSLQTCVETIIDDKVQGDLIETGVWRGGACIMMKAVLEAYGDSSRRIFVADSFEGLPKPDQDQFPSDAGATFHNIPYLSVSLEEVRHNFARYGLLDNRVIFLKGWFKDTLPTLPSNRLAVMRLDGDMYESTIQGLTNLYPKLSTGGFCIIDDWPLGPCKKAVEDYRKANNIHDEIVDPGFGGFGVFWRKTT
ncbi:MAG: TylF/MycF/NovP-related O-methyltransferase [bacterium]